MSNNLNKTMEYNIYLPDNYNKNVNYPVCYLLHGAYGNEDSWVKEGDIKKTADELIDKKLIDPLIIVMPDAFIDSWYIDSPIYKMESAFIEEFIPHIENIFKVDGSKRFIAGLSMGGYGSLRFVLLYPDMFKGAGLLSPAIYDPVPPENSAGRKTPVFGENGFDENIWESYNYPQYIEDYLNSNYSIPMYIVSGDDDEYNVEYYSTLLYEKLKKSKKPSELRIIDGKHSWDVWKNTIDDALIYLFQSSKKNN
jgi:enterochelin esterase-like enzyme